MRKQGDNTNTGGIQETTLSPKLISQSEDFYTCLPI